MAASWVEAVNVLGKTGDACALPRQKGRGKEGSGEGVGSKEVRKGEAPQEMVAHQHCAAKLGCQREMLQEAARKAPQLMDADRKSHANKLSTPAESMRDGRGTQEREMGPHSVPQWSRGHRS